MAVQQKILRRNRNSNRDISYKRWSLQFPGSYNWFDKLQPDGQGGATAAAAAFASFSQFDRNDVLAYFPATRGATGAAATCHSLTDLTRSPNPVVRSDQDFYKRVSIT